MSEQETNTYRYAIRLMIKHPSITPASITGTLGLAPGRSWAAGEARRTPTGTLLPGVYDVSYWNYSYDVEGTRLFFSEVVGLLDRLESHSEYLLEITATGGTIQLIANLPGGRNIGDTLRWPALKRLSALRIDLGVEVFPDS